MISETDPEEINALHDTTKLLTYEIRLLSNRK